MTADLTVREQAAEMVDEVRPDYVFHLAAQSYVPEAFRHPEATIMNNVVGQLNLLDPLRQVSPDARVLVVCSSEPAGIGPGLATCKQHGESNSQSEEPTTYWRRETSVQISR